MTITNTRTIPPGRITIAEPVRDARTIETAPPQASTPITIPNPTAGEPRTSSRLVLAAPVLDASVVVPASQPELPEPEPEPETGPRRKRS